MDDDNGQFRHIFEQAEEWQGTQVKNPANQELHQDNSIEIMQVVLRTVHSCTTKTIWQYHQLITSLLK